MLVEVWMPVLKSLLSRARKAAKDHLPGEVVEAGKKLRDTVVELAPAPIAEVFKDYVPETEGDAPPAEPAEPAPAESTAPLREPARDVLDRVKTKADKGLKPEDRVVVVYATPEQQEDVAAILEILETVETTVREIDLDRERPKVRTQLAELTGVMVPPYVYVNGRYWGARYELESLAGSGELELVVANRLDELSEEARRIGKVHDSYSDEISVENVMKRWKLGHILCIDDLDAWYEVDKDGTEHFFYQGGPRDVADMPAVAEEVVAAVEAEEYEAIWQLEPTVHVS
ncbi:MAG: hypothetical protein AAF721_17595 [Myxococcota bacterium]